MKSLEEFRQAEANATRRTLGHVGALPSVMAHEVLGSHFFVAQMALPCRYADPIMVLDSGSADFGKFYFLPGYDAPGSDHPLGP